MVHPQVREAVEQECVQAAERFGDLVQDSESDEDADVGEGYEGLLASGENVGCGVQMALLVLWGLLAVGADHAVDTGAGVDQNVCGPAEKLVDGQGGDAEDWRVGSGVVHYLLNKSRCRGVGGLFRRLAVWHENGVLLHVVVVTVVPCVAEFPAEEWHEKHAVEDPSHCGVDVKMGGKRVVAALVSQNPETGEEAAGDKAVERP